jgi:hypothetical protein
MAFKLGDRVRVNDGVPDLGGETGTVTRVYPADNYFAAGCGVVLDSDEDEMSAHFHDTEITKVAEVAA